jgi:hypothetical protein
MYQVKIYLSQKMKKILLVLTFVLLIGCKNDSISFEQTGKDNQIRIEFLFEKDGIKMYRFYDAYHYHYFTTKGDVSTIQQAGKVTYEERIELK